MDDGFQLEQKALLDERLKVTTNSNKGHAVYAFFTTTCPHCMAASDRLGTNISGGQTIPVYSIFPGNEGNSTKFLSDFNGESFVSCDLNNDALFLKLSGGMFPSIFVVDKDGKTVYHWTGDEMNYSALDYLLNLEQ